MLSCLRICWHIPTSKLQTLSLIAECKDIGLVSLSFLRIRIVYFVYPSSLQSYSVQIFDLYLFSLLFFFIDWPRLSSILALRTLLCVFLLPSFFWVHWFWFEESELAGANCQLCGFRRWVLIGFGFGIGKRLNCCEFWWLTHLGTIKKLANHRLPSMEGTPATVIRPLCLQRIIPARLLRWSTTQVSQWIGHLMSRSHWKKGLRSEFFLFWIYAFELLVFMVVA